MNWLPHYHHGRASSVVHRLSPGVKLACALVLIVGTALAPERWVGWYAAVFAVLAVIAALSRVPLWFLIKRLLLLSPFVLGVAAVNAFHHETRGHWQIVATRGFLCLLTVLLVAHTTPFGRTLHVLRRAKVPALLITMMALMQRYLFVLADESERMSRARRSRTFHKRKRIEWRLPATVVSQLFIRASERAERIYEAMCARGWK
jgi:cobalt/nickel transport system permease protein